MPSDKALNRTSPFNYRRREVMWFGYLTNGCGDMLSEVIRRKALKNKKEDNSLNTILFALLISTVLALLIVTQCLTDVKAELRKICNIVKSESDYIDNDSELYKACEGV